VASATKHTTLIALFLALARWQRKRPIYSPVKDVVDIGNGQLPASDNLLSVFESLDSKLGLVILIG
jgi:hypothetical protein